MSKRDQAEARQRERDLRFTQARARRDSVSDLFKERLSSFLREHRDGAKLTQREFAALVGMRHPAYNFIETGKSPVHADTLFELALQLDIPLQDLWALWLECRNEYEAGVDADLSEALSTLDPSIARHLSTLPRGDLLELLAKSQSEAAQKGSKGQVKADAPTRKKK